MAIRRAQGGGGRLRLSQKGMRGLYSLTQCCPMSLSCLAVPGPETCMLQLQATGASTAPLEVVDDWMVDIDDLCRH